MIAGVEHARVLRQAGIGERIEHQADVVVEERAEAVIAGERLFQFHLVEVIVVVETVRVVTQVGMGRALAARIQLRQRQVAVVVAVEILRRRGQREVRADQRDEQYPRLAWLCCLLARELLLQLRDRLFAQPDLGARGDFTIVESVLALTGAGQSRHLIGAAAHRQIAAHQAHQVALAFEDVHRNDFFRKTVVFAVETEVQFAHRHHRMPALAQLVVPTRHCAVIGVGIVPVAHLVDVLADRERRACRNADRAGAIGGAEAGAACGEAIQIRRFDERMSVAAERLRAVLVGHDDQEILRWTVHGGAHGATSCGSRRTVSHTRNRWPPQWHRRSAAPECCPSRPASASQSAAS